VAGFALRFFEIQSERQQADVAHRLELTEQALAFVAEELKRRETDLTAGEQLKALTEAVTALKEQQGPDVDEALEALADGDTSKAKEFFQQIARCNHRISPRPPQPGEISAHSPFWMIQKKR
jgi:hypothetical protein